MIATSLRSADTTRSPSASHLCLALAFSPPSYSVLGDVIRKIWLVHSRERLWYELLLASLVVFDDDVDEDYNHHVLNSLTTNCALCLRHLLLNLDAPFILFFSLFDLRIIRLPSKLSRVPQGTRRARHR